MGYEIELIIGKPSTTYNGSCMFFTYATLDVCTPRYTSELYKLAKKENSTMFEYYIYGIDGDTRVKGDLYGKKLNPIKIEIVLAALKKDIKNNEYYRRYMWAKSLLKSMIKHSGGEQLYVIFFGH